MDEFANKFGKIKLKNSKEQLQKFVMLSLKNRKLGELKICKMKAKQEGLKRRIKWTGEEFVKSKHSGKSHINQQKATQENI